MSRGPHLLLVGLMGAGKTTVGQRCAELLGRPFVDTDELVVAAVGVSFEELWASEGEAGFRARERVAVADAAASPTPLVIAGGGGVVLDPDNRRVLRASGFVVWLDAPPAVLASRLAGDDSRPLLAGGDRVTTLTRLGDTRAPAYEAAADVTVDTEGRTVDEVVAAVLEEFSSWSERQRTGYPGEQRATHGLERVTVAIPGAPYDVVVGEGALAEVAGVVGTRRKVAVVSQAGVADFHAPALTTALHGAGAETDVFLIGDGEEAKTLATVNELCSQLAGWGLLRGDAIVALGGGVVGDTAGFVAAVYYRGIAVVQAPTTLLAQVDAAIGGKTAVNLPEGKNLVGAFHQPIAVLADVSTLATLPPREFRAGLGEVAKYALMPGGERVAAIVRDRADAVIARDVDVLTGLVAACAAMKARVVAADPEERTGIRASLNYGHTFAHALETAGGYELLHGEAVAVGLVFAGALAGALERLDAEAVDRHRVTVESLGLPFTVPGQVSAADLLHVMRRDKKSLGGLTFVLPGADGLETVHDPDPRALDIAFAAVGVGS